MIENDTAYLLMNYIQENLTSFCIQINVIERFTTAPLSAAMRTCGCAAVQQGGLTL